MPTHRLAAIPHCRPHRSRPVLRAGLLALACLFPLRPLPAAAQAFGGAVLVADGRVLVGEAAHEREPGTVRAYGPDAGGWTEVALLQGPGASVRDGFGRSLAHANGFLFVGAGAGLVHVYRLADVGRAETTPVQTLTRPGLGGFGDVLATSGTGLMALAVADGELSLAEFREGVDGHWEHAGTLGTWDPGRGNRYGPELEQGGRCPLPSLRSRACAKAAQESGELTYGPRSTTIRYCSTSCHLLAPVTRRRKEP
ncbi:MAG: hypothetical protein OXK74_18185 [Gemmatimonadota bacterium]|nr:hypothetical protein [Gemmatimonadota bacterium]